MPVGQQGRSERPRKAQCIPASSKSCIRAFRKDGIRLPAMMPVPWKDVPSRPGWNGDKTNLASLKASEEDIKARRAKVEIENVDLVRASIKWKKKEAKLQKKVERLKQQLLERDELSAALNTKEKNLRRLRRSLDMRERKLQLRELEASKALVEQREVSSITRCTQTGEDLEKMANARKEWQLERQRLKNARKCRIEEIERREAGCAERERLLEAKIHALSEARAAEKAEIAAERHDLEQAADQLREGKQALKDEQKIAARQFERVKKREIEVHAKDCLAQEMITEHRASAAASAENHRMREAILREKERAIQKREENVEKQERSLQAIAAGVREREKNVDLREDADKNARKSLEQERRELCASQARLAAIAEDVESEKQSLAKEREKLASQIAVAQQRCSNDTST